MPDRTVELARQYVARAKTRDPATEPSVAGQLAEIRRRWTPGATADAFTTEASTRTPRARQALADVNVLLARVALLEDFLLAGAKLLYPGEDWGPEPEGAGQSYVDYLHEGYLETAAEIRDRAVRRG